MAVVSDELRELYLEIVKKDLKSAELIVQNCWRYHMTFIKVLETIIHTEHLYEETPPHLQVSASQQGLVGGALTAANSKSDSTSVATSKSKQGISINKK